MLGEISKFKLNDNWKKEKWSRIVLGSTYIEIALPRVSGRVGCSPGGGAEDCRGYAMESWTKSL